MADYKELSSIKDFDMFDGTFESIKDNLFMRLFNKRNLPLNKDLKVVPHINYADLAVTYSVEERTYFNGNKGLHSYLITNEDMELLKVNENTLKEVAIKNLLLRNSARIETINEHIIRNHIFSPLTKIPDNAASMIHIEGPNKKSSKLFEGNEFGQIPIINSENTKDVLLISNRTQTFASVNLIMPNVLEEVYDKFGENFYILPSSVHELICIRAGFITNEGDKPEKQAIQDMEDMVEQINDVIHQNTSNILSYNIYYHLHDDKCTMIVK